MPDEPATEQQLNYLRHLGYVPEQALTKHQALELIRHYREHPPKPIATVILSDQTRTEAYRLRKLVDQAKRAEAVPVGAIPATASGTEIIPREGNHLDLATATLRRQEFWLDTCRETKDMRGPSPQVLELYQKYGCRCYTPTYEQTQEVLTALDSAFPFWDRDHPEFFYQTLELNFPETVRRM